MRIVIIGCTRGLGLALAKIFAEGGHDIVCGIRGDVAPDGLAVLAERFPGHVSAVPCDVTQESQVEAAAAFASQRLGRIDALLHVAGVIMPSDRIRTIEEAVLDDLHRTFDVNTIGPIAVMKHFSPLMAENAPFLVMTSEGLGLYECGSWIPGYSLSKAAATKAVGIARLTAKGVRYYAVHPGRMNTDMGRTTAQIEPEETAASLYQLVTEDRLADEWYIDYKGASMAPSSEQKE